MVTKRIKLLPTVLTLALIVGVGWRVLTLSVAPDPPLFSAGYSLSQAQLQAHGRPVLAVFTAEWCGACQSYKRGALADSRVERYVSDHLVPVMVDFNTAESQAEAFGVGALPATVVLREGKVVARSEGAMGAEELIDWLRSIDASKMTEGAAPASSHSAPGQRATLGL